MSSVCLSRHPAVAYLVFVRSMEPTSHDTSPRRMRMSTPVWVVVASAIFGLLVAMFSDSLSTASVLLLGSLFGLVIALFWMMPALRRPRRRYETDPLRRKRQT
jgi:L-asparagine transporter-like permease